MQERARGISMLSITQIMTRGQSFSHTVRYRFLLDCWRFRDNGLANDGARLTYAPDTE